jgi:hypothetical protein
MDWTSKEVKLTVDAYFDMLQYELKHLKYNKTDYRNKLLPYLKGRSPGAVERKHQNISAVLSKMGLPFIKGYKPLPHYQQILEDSVADYLDKNKSPLEKDFSIFSDEIIPQKPLQKINFAELVDSEGPKPIKIKTDKEPAFKPIKINYLEREQNNRLLGLQGEELVIKYERWRLIKAGKISLADKIEWVSKDLGDGAGYDILSKNENGTDRYIEVKTTKLTKETPIYLSKTEVAFAILNAKNFFLYRIFNWDIDPQLFIKNGAYDSFCKLQALSFKGVFL